MSAAGPLRHLGELAWALSELESRPLELPAGRSFTRDYRERILPLPQPHAIVPTRYDNFFRPLGEPMEFVANVELAGLPDEIAAVSRNVELAALPRTDSQAPI